MMSIKLLKTRINNLWLAPNYHSWRYSYKGNSDCLLHHFALWHILSTRVSTVTLYIKNIYFLQLWTWRFFLALTNPLYHLYIMHCVYNGNFAQTLIIYLFSISLVFTLMPYKQKFITFLSLIQNTVHMLLLHLNLKLEKFNKLSLLILFFTLTFMELLTWFMDV